MTSEDPSNKMFEGEELWRRSKAANLSTNVSSFVRKMNEKHALNAESYQAIYDFSIQHIELFWREIWYYVGIKASSCFEKVLQARLAYIKIAISVFPKELPFTFYLSPFTFHLLTTPSSTGT